MASLKDLRVRIKSVKNTQQITKTMKMVAAAKVRRARLNCENARPYAEKLSGVLTNLSKSIGENSDLLLLSGREEVKTVLVMVIGSDRGLCGGFNGNLGKKALAFISEQEKLGYKVKIVTVGKKVKAILKNHGDIIATYEDISKDLNYAKAEEISLYLTKEFENGNVDQINMVYSEFKSMMTQSPYNQALVPFASNILDDKETEIASAVEYEPSEETILSSLLPKNLVVQVYRGLLESNASEQASRMTAMDNASRNAGDMIKELSVKYNRSRQAAITSELIEIISGAEALK